MYLRSACDTLQLDKSLKFFCARHPSVINFVKHGPIVLERSPRISLPSVAYITKRRWRHGASPPSLGGTLVLISWFVRHTWPRFRLAQDFLQ
jgi:hypothetical protein